MKVVALLCALCVAAAGGGGDKSPSKHDDDDDQASAAPQLQYVSWGHWGDGAGAESAPATGGFSWYTRIMDWVQEPYSIESLSVGMGATWMQRVTNDPNTSCACPLDKTTGLCGSGNESAPRSKLNRGNQSCDWLMQSMEGGPGLGRTELPTTRTKWRIGDSVGCYHAYTGAPLFQFGQFPGHACSPKDETPDHPMAMAFIQLSNKLLMLPDGITFAKHGSGMLGVAYVKTPFGKVNATDARNFWTVVLDSASFSGPLGYFLPEFWAIRAPGLEEATRDFKDFGTVDEIHMSGGAFEINSIPTFNSSGLKPGSTALRLPKMAMPLVDGRTVLFMGNRVFSKAEVYDPLEKALAAGGTLDPSAVLSKGTRHPCTVGNQTAVTGSLNSWGRFYTSIENDECVWSATHFNESCCDTMEKCYSPQFLDGETRLPLEPEEVPRALREATYPRKAPSGPYSALNASAGPPGGCRDTPGPASPTLYCIQSQSPSWVAYRWYRFVDQPGLQQALHSQAERDFLQNRVALLHKMLGEKEGNDRWIKRRGAAAQGIARIDDAAIVVPPKGMEHGYVPIALYEGLEKPEGCQVEPTPAPSPVPPTRPAPHCKRAPQPTTCNGRCQAAGHCCLGTVANDGRPSCEQGCIVANYTDSVDACQKVCRDHQHNCTWSIGGIAMTACAANCPVGCNSGDGPYECEAGCAFAFNAR